ncbi:hypothetical protein JB92DRAFT_2836571 [Gautieria morchelliformis]|nr:hypothetical protein JB92DRAFT_2836571 [Gautieria morchelliformis]
MSDDYDYTYSYAYPSPPSTASSSRLRALPHLHPYSSPLPCTHTHTHSHAPAYGQRASKASDIAHLLDPSYSPTRTHARAADQIYVDHAGEAHDPDFRLFARTPASFSPKRREFLTCDSESDADADDDDDADGQDVDDEGVALYSSSKRASFESARSASRLYRPESRASDPLYYGRATQAQDDAYAAAFTYTFEAPGYLSDDEPPRETNKLRRRRASMEPDRPLHHTHTQPQAQPAMEPARAEWTQTTTSTGTLRRQWHALRLRTQVAAFRARKRVSTMISPSAG